MPNWGLNEITRLKCINRLFLFKTFAFLSSKPSAILQLAIHEINGKKIKIKSLENLDVEKRVKLHLHADLSRKVRVKKQINPVKRKKKRTRLK